VGFRMEGLWGCRCGELDIAATSADHTGALTRSRLAPVSGLRTLVFKAQGSGFRVHGLQARARQTTEELTQCRLAPGSGPRK